MKDRKVDVSDDSSDEEILVRTGEVPREWYKNEPHLGYSVHGQKVSKQASLSAVDQLIKSEEDPNFWRTIHDELNNKTITLSDEQIALLRKIRDRAYPSDAIREKSYIFEVPSNPFPQNSRPLPKRRFTPSKHERLRVNKYIHAIKMGWIRDTQDTLELPPVDAFFAEASDPWQKSSDKELSDLPPPRLTLPGHEASFNPPPEYVKGAITPISSLRHLSFNELAIKEQFERLMSLYMAPRQLRKRINMKASELLEPLPDPQELRPFPSRCVSRANFRSNPLKSLAVSADGCLAAVVDEFNNVALMNVPHLSLISTLNLQSENVLSASFTRHSGLMLVSEDFVDFFAFRTSRENFKAATARFTAFAQTEQAQSAGISVEFPFLAPGASNKFIAHIARVRPNSGQIVNASLHHRENFLAFLVRRGDSRKIEVLNFAKLSTTTLSLKTKTAIQKIEFSPTKAQLIILSQTHVFLYDLVKHENQKKLLTGAKGLSCLAIHRTGSNILVGSKDRQLLWFDLDWKNLPYKKMRVHSGALENCRFSQHLNLFSSSADDGSIVVQFGKVDEVGFASPQIVPLKTLKGHKVYKNRGVTDNNFINGTHWILSVGYDGNIFLWA